MKESEEAAFIWTECEDLVVLTDMYQIRIKVITTKGPDDKTVSASWIHPDPDLEKYAMLKKVKLNDMILLHEKDSHFNLVVSRNSDLATLGSLSYRFNVGPIIEERQKKKKETEQVNEGNKTDEVKFNTDQEKPDESDGITGDNDEVKPEKNNIELVELKKELNKCKKSKEFIEREYIKCEKELRMKTEEAEKFKIEIKDLKKMMELRNDIDEKNNEKLLDEEDGIEYLKQLKKRGFTRKTPQAESLPKCNLKEFKCGICDYTASSEVDLKRHIRSYHSEKAGQNENSGKKMEEFNCTECDFQVPEEIQLRKHIDLKHTEKCMDNTGAFKCRVCGDEFSEKWNLMSHRKSNHPGTVAYCTKFEAGICSFTAEFCWWNHDKKECIEKFNAFFVEQFLRISQN